MAAAGDVLVSVIIPTRNAGQGFDGLLEAVGAQRIPGRLQVVVIDSSSRDGTAQRARRAGALVLSIPRRRFDHGWARNRAIAASAGRFAALTVQDAVPTDEGWLGQMLEPLLAQPEAAGSYGLQVAPSSAGLLARTRSRLWSEAQREARVQSVAGPAEWATLAPEERLERIRFDNVTSCIRRAAWETTPFPEGGFGEDMRWAREVLLAGHTLLSVPTAQVWHSHERGWFYDLRRAYHDGQNRVQMAGAPSAGLTAGEALAVLRRLFFFAQTHRFDSVWDAAAVQQLVKEERRHYEPLARERPVSIYLEALRFGLQLTEQAAALSAGGHFREGEWIRLLRFALAVHAGHALGTTAAWTIDDGRWTTMDVGRVSIPGAGARHVGRPPGPAGGQTRRERAFWHCLDWALGHAV